MCFTQRHEISSQSFLSPPVSWTVVLQQVQRLSGRHVLAISSAWKRQSYLLLSCFTSPGSMARHGTQKNKKWKTVESQREKRQKQIGTPWLRQLGFIVCGEKVVIEVGSTPWKSEPVWLSENNDGYDEVLLMWALCWASRAGDEAVGEGKRASCGDTDQIWCSVQRCGAQKGQIKTQPLVWVRGRKKDFWKEEKKKQKENRRHLAGFVWSSVPLRHWKKRDVPVPEFPISIYPPLCSPHIHTL